MAPIVILSPHQDDAVLSLWHVLTGPRDVSVVNVFAGPPTTERLGWWDAETGASNPASRARERRAEDRAALALAGRSAIDLDFVDDQYRQREQPVEAVAAAIAAAAPDGAFLLAPAGLGAHVDHRLARAAALRLGAQGIRVALYADIPHATREGWPAWVTNGAPPNAAHEPSARWRADMNGSGVALGELAPRVHALDPAQAERKMAAVAEYRTQVPALETEFSLLTRPEILQYEIVWAL